MPIPTVHSMAGVGIQQLCEADVGGSGARVAAGTVSGIHALEPDVSAAQPTMQAEESSVSGSSTGVGAARLMSTPLPVALADEGFHGAVSRLSPSSARDAAAMVEAAQELELLKYRQPTPAPAATAAPVTSPAAAPAMPAGHAAARQQPSEQPVVAAAQPRVHAATASASANRHAYAHMHHQQDAAAGGKLRGAHSPPDTPASAFHVHHSASDDGPRLRRASLSSTVVASAGTPASSTAHSRRGSFSGLSALSSPTASTSSRGSQCSPPTPVRATSRPRDVAAMGVASPVRRVGGGYAYCSPTAAQLHPPAAEKPTLQAAADVAGAGQPAHTDAFTLLSPSDVLSPTSTEALSVRPEARSFGSLMARLRSTLDLAAQVSSGTRVLDTCEQRADGRQAAADPEEPAGASAPAKGGQSRPAVLPTANALPASHADISSASGETVAQLATGDSFQQAGNTAQAAVNSEHASAADDAATAPATPTALQQHHDGGAESLHTGSAHADTASRSDASAQADEAARASDADTLLSTSEPAQPPSRRSARTSSTEGFAAEHLLQLNQQREQAAAPSASSPRVETHASNDASGNALASGASGSAAAPAACRATPPKQRRVSFSDDILHATSDGDGDGTDTLPPSEPAPEAPPSSPASAASISSRRSMRSALLEAKQRALATSSTRARLPAGARGRRYASDTTAGFSQAPIAAADSNCHSPLSTSLSDLPSPGAWSSGSDSRLVTHTIAPHQTDDVGTQTTFPPTAAAERPPRTTAKLMAASAAVDDAFLRRAPALAMHDAPAATAQRDVTSAPTSVGSHPSLPARISGRSGFDLDIDVWATSGPRPRVTVTCVDGTTVVIDGVSGGGAGALHAPARASQPQRILPPVRIPSAPMPPHAWSPLQARATPESNAPVLSSYSSSPQVLERSLQRPRGTGGPTMADTADSLHDIAALLRNAQARASAIASALNTAWPARR